MFQYLEAMVQNKELSFPSELLRPMYELYLDISTMYLNEAESNSMSHQ